MLGRKDRDAEPTCRHSQTQTAADGDQQCHLGAGMRACRAALLTERWRCERVSIRRLVPSIRRRLPSISCGGAASRLPRPCSQLCAGCWVTPQHPLVPLPPNWRAFLALKVAIWSAAITPALCRFACSASALSATPHTRARSAQPVITEEPVWHQKHGCRPPPLPATRATRAVKAAFVNLQPQHRAFGLIPPGALVSCARLAQSSCLPPHPHSVGTEQARGPMTHVRSGGMNTPGTLLAKPTATGWREGIAGAGDLKHVPDVSSADSQASRWPLTHRRRWPPCALRPTGRRFPWAWAQLGITPLPRCVPTVRPRLRSPRRRRCDIAFAGI